MDMEIYKDDLKNSEKLNDEIIHQFIKLRKDCDACNKEYVEIQKEYELLTEKLNRGRERLGQLIDEYKFISQVDKKVYHPKERTQSSFCVWIVVIVYFFILFSFSLLIFNNKKKNIIKNLEIKELDYII